MSPPPVPRVSVGVCDTPEADRAVQWAAHHAHVTGAQLHLVHAFVWTELDVNTDPIPGVTGSGIRAAADGLIEDAVAIARAVHPDLEITSQIIDGNPVPVLVDVSTRSDVLVLGGRGLGRLLTLIVGSKSLALASRAHCPVVVVRGDIAVQGPIGLVHHPRGEDAVERAALLAAAYRRPIQLVARADADQQRAQQVLAEVRETIGRTHPQVAVAGVTIPATHAPRELVQASEGAAMIVVAGERVAGQEGRIAAPRQLVTVLRYANTPVWIERA